MYWIPTDTRGRGIMGCAVDVYDTTEESYMGKSEDERTPCPLNATCPSDLCRVTFRGQGVLSSSYWLMYGSSVVSYTSYTEFTGAITSHCSFVWWPSPWRGGAAQEAPHRGER